MKQNYQKMTEAFVSSMTQRRTLALHSCCAPCSSSVLEYLTQHFDVTLFYYNPNIDPPTEYERRLQEQLCLCKKLGVQAVSCAYDPASFYAAVKGLEDAPEGGARCAACFRLRLSYTAHAAKQAGFDLLTTTLTVSPHKNAQLVNEIGAQVAAAEGIEWLFSDFKKKNGFLRSLELSRQYGLYRQDYCGCVFSRQQREKETADEKTNAQTEVFA